ncbi:MAG TPA: glycosyl hydrolase family 28-related protein, partial [Polyangiaceae bacterium]|nr:glycosyl hydrolase family 28-related protein [Polyangiaceae bacterium]
MRPRVGFRSPRAATYAFALAALGCVGACSSAGAHGGGKPDPNGNDAGSGGAASASAGSGGAGVSGRRGTTGGAGGAGGANAAIGSGGTAISGSGGNDGGGTTASGGNAGAPSGGSAGTGTGNTSGSAPAARGATLPYDEYEAEDATTNGAVIGPSRTFGDPASEASGRRAVRLSTTGQYVRFTPSRATNSIVVRYSIPDSANGGGAAATLGVLVNGERKASLALTSRYSWTYGDADAQGMGSESPGAGTAHHYFDEAHALLGEVAAGATVALQRDAGDDAASYVVDLVDLEEVAAPLAMPAGALSILDYGATANDANDDGPAIQRAIDAASSQGKTVWIPRGTFDSTTAAFHVADVAIRGAGMWYSVLNGAFARFKVSG